jgi:hypothetical protein
MSDSPKIDATVRCACGRVELEAAGAPILTAVCHCDDCDEAGRRIEALPGAAPVRESGGGTAYVLYRKDRVVVSKGADLLARHKLDGNSPTNLLVATCCNSAMLLNFDDAKWWVDIYRPRYRENVPPVDMHICTKFIPEGRPIPDDAPAFPSYPVRFIVRQIAARLAMLLRL